MRPTKFRDEFSADDLRLYLHVTLDESVYYFGPNFSEVDSEGHEYVNWPDLTSSTMCLVLCGSFYSMLCYTGIKL
ncbi:unnamed protein product, partial [Mesorhabditis spiculigera]